MSSCVALKPFVHSGIVELNILYNYVMSLALFNKIPYHSGQFRLLIEKPGKLHVAILINSQKPKHLAVPLIFIVFIFNGFDINKDMLSLHLGRGMVRFLHHILLWAFSCRAILAGWHHSTCKSPVIILGCLARECFQAMTKLRMRVINRNRAPCWRGRQSCHSNSLHETCKQVAVGSCNFMFKNNLTLSL